MNSIDKNQAEDTHKNLNGVAAVEKIKELVKMAPTCFFCTAVATAETGAARPMSVQQVDDLGNLWFLSPNDSHTNLELSKNPAVRLFFQGSSHSDFLHLNGRGTISTDKEKIKELWEPIIKTWFTGGVDDPRITVIKVEPTEGYYWDTKHGKMVAGIKMMIGAMVGKTMDDSVQGKIQT